MSLGGIKLSVIKTTLSLTDYDRQWMDKMIASGEFVSNSEYIRNLIRKDRELRTESEVESAYIREKLIRAEQSGFVNLNRDELLATFKNRLQKDGNI